MSAFEAVHVVAPATAAQKRGFILLSPEEAADDGARARAVASIGPAVGAVGVEVPIEFTDAGTARVGVVRVALPQDGRIFCTWQLTVARDALTERVGVLSAARMRQLEAVIRLAGIAVT